MLFSISTEAFGNCGGYIIFVADKEIPGSIQVKIRRKAL